MDRSDFLEPGFDPSSLKVAELRGILHGHEVSFPSSAKKADLIQLFNENIVPKAADLLRDKSAVEPTGSGIIDAPPRRRTRSVSPAKSPSRQRSPKKESGATASASSSPRKATSRKTKTEPASSVILEQGPLLEAPKEMKSKVSSEVQSPVSPKKGKKKLSTKSIVDPNVQEKEEDLNSKSQAAAITVVGSPRKRGSKKNEKLSVKDAEKEDLIKGESIDSIKSKRESSPFSAENVFQQGSPKTSPKVAKSPKSSKKRSLQDLEDTLTPAKKRAPSKKLESSLNVAPSSSNIAEDNGKSPVRHFSNFPSSPEEPPKPQGSPQPHSQLMEDIPSSAFSSSSQRHSVPFAASMDISQYSTPDSTVSHTQTSQHTFTGKRLSFMPSLDNLRVSNQFLKQLQKEVGESTDDDQMKSIDPNVEEETTEETELEKLKVEVEEENNKVEKKGIKVSTDTRSPTSAVSESTGISWTSFFVTILLTVATVYSVWWSKERFEIGYCDVNFLSHSQIEKGDEPIFEKYLDYIKPSCVACPNHATCYPNFKVVCEEDFVYRPNLFSLGGRLPLAPACLPDTEKQRRIQALAKHARLVLREQNAKAECGENVPAGIEESELHNILKNLKSPYLSDEDFEELWKNAVKDIEKDDEVIVRHEF